MAPFPVRALGQERAISEPPWDKDARRLNGANSMKGKAPLKARRASGHSMKRQGGLSGLIL